MSAAELRRAAATLRERAEAATVGPWVTDDHFHSDRDRVYVVAADPDVHNYVSAGGGIADDNDAPYIATVHPGVGLALAQSLDDHAQNHDCYECGWEPCALVAVARLINGGAT